MTLILWVKGQVELRDYCSSTAQVVVTIISWLKLRAETMQICIATRAWCKPHVVKLSDVILDPFLQYLCWNCLYLGPGGGAGSWDSLQSLPQSRKLATCTCTCTCRCRSKWPVRVYMYMYVFVCMCECVYMYNYVRVCACVACYARACSGCIYCGPLVGHVFMLG